MAVVSVALLLALLLVLGSGALTADRLLAPSGRWWVLAMAFVPAALLGYLLAAVLLALVRRGRGTGLRRVASGGLVVCLVGALLHLAWLLPSFAGSHASGRPDVTVLTFNLLKGQADVADLAALVRRERPGVVVLTEATPEAVRGLERARAVGPGSRLPERGGAPDNGVQGTVAFSRWRVTPQAHLPLQHNGYRMRVQAPAPFVLTALHVGQPAYSLSSWQRDLGLLDTSTRAVRGPQLLAGDFNATLDHGPLRRLLGAGLQDSAQQANAGWQPTWPSPGAVVVHGVRLPFGLFAIDHVLLSSAFSAVSTETFRVPGSDHLALVARLRMR